MIILKEMDISDITDEYISSLNNPKLNKYIITKKATREDCVRFVTQHKHDPCSKMYGIFETAGENDSKKTLVGTMTLKNIDFAGNNATLGIFIWKTGSQIGTMAISLIKQELKRMGITRMNLGVYSNNKSAVKFYEKSGFSPADSSYLLNGIKLGLTLHLGERPW